jgi:hypothetical protein
VVSSIVPIQPIAASYGERRPHEGHPKPAPQRFLMRQSRTWLLAGVAGSLLLPLNAVAHAPGTVPGLSWLSGCWHGGSASRQTEEHWSKPAGDSLIGMSRTIRDGKTVAYEFLQIRREGEEVHYIAQPNGGPKTAFKLVRSGEREVVFENPEHDFPQRILYRLEPDGSLFARIEGQVNGQPRGQDFPMKRAKCDP